MSVESIDAAIDRIVQSYQRIAVVGLSPKLARPSYRATLYMQQQGYLITPVNPQHSEILGERCYPDLRSIPHPIEVVDLFQRAENVAPFVEQAIEIGAKVIWMQLGIVNHAAAALAERAGLAVVMDRCMKIEHARLQRQGKTPPWQAH